MLRVENLGILPRFSPLVAQGLYIEAGPDVSLNFWSFNGEYVDDEEYGMDTLFGFIAGGGIVGVLEPLMLRAGVHVHIMEKMRFSFPFTIGIYLDPKW